MTHVKWTEIESLHAVRRHVASYHELLRGIPIVTYRGKVKLHGTNAGVQIKCGGRVNAQSRTMMLSEGNDNAGFAAWLATDAVTQAFRAANRWITKDVVIFGEWCGPGVQKGVAVSQIPKKCFAIFAAVILDSAGEPTDDLITDPDSLSEFVDGVPDAYVLPWFGDDITVDLLAPADELTPIVERINAIVEGVEAEDPWVSRTFGVKGTGEGVVYYPISHSGRKSFSELAFKAKGEKHQVIAHAKPAQLDPQVAESIDKFAELVLPTPRLEQGARAVARGELTFDAKLIGPFLKWIGDDVQKETAAELQASDLTWKQVQKSVSDRARKWYIEASNSAR